MIQDIDKNIAIVNDTLRWAKEYGKESFPVDQFKEYRRKLSKIRKALTGNCSAAAYGESQVGKSYLMSSLLSSAEHPFVIEYAGREYSFIDQINPSGGEKKKIESTGVVTRFTIRKGDHVLKDCVKIENLSVIDLILLLADSYYNDIKIDVETSLTSEAINRELDSLAHLWAGKTVQHQIITEDDIRDINDYIKDVIGNNAAAVFQSNFCRVIAPVIQYIPYDKWVDVFSLLWNKNPELNRLFATLINAYKKLDFKQMVYVPYTAVLKDTGTLLKIQWLDTVCSPQTDTGNDIIYTDVYDEQGRLLASNFSKGELSALIAEITFELSDSVALDRKFLRDMDLLDFPGARSREEYKESEISTVLPMMLRRGKVAYLFNKYSRSLQISSVLFCHHNDQKAESTLGETINGWIVENIGNTPEERTQMLRLTGGISPLFFVATKFNIELEKTKNDKAGDYQALDKHWDRFDKIFPEIIKPNTWFEKWAVASNGAVSPFKSIYPLRDFYWSCKQGVFDGFSDEDIKSPELSVHVYSEYPDFLDRLRESFLRFDFVNQHFDDPERAWDEFATLNNDGSKAIIRDLDSISPVLDRARRERYRSQLEEIKRDIIKSLSVFYEPEDTESKNKKVRLIAGDIRRSLMQTVATNPAVFGRILDSLMVSPEALRNIAYDIIVCHTDTPKDFSAVNFIRASAGIDINDSRQVNIDKLLTYYICETEDDLIEYLQSQGFELEDVIARESLTLSTIGDVITKHIVEYWIEHLNATAKLIVKSLPHADEVVFMLMNLFKKLNVRKAISEKITRYTEIFSENEQPNAIGDYSALTLNNFVSTVGRHYMSDNEIGELRVKAQNCRLPVDFSPTGWDKVRKPQPLIDTLKVFDESATIVNQGRIDISVLRQLPFWNNYQRWENFVIIGLIYSSDISQCDPVCNEKVKNLIERTEPLYNE